MKQLLSAYIASLFLESLLFGAFTITYAMGVWSLVRPDCPGRPSSRNWVVLVVSTAMYVLAVVHVAFSIKINVSGFVWSAGTLEAVYDALSRSVLGSSSGNARYYIYVTQVLIGDAFMVYRLYVAWEYRWKVALGPSILFLLGAVVGYVFGNSIISIAFFSLSFLTNALVSALILWRVLGPRKEGRAHNTVGERIVVYRKVFEAIVQSALIYTITSISLIIMFFLSPNIGLSACLGVFPPLIGLLFSLIVLRIGESSDERVPPTHVPASRHTGRTQRRSAESLTFAFPPPEDCLSVGPDVESRTDAESTGWQGSVLVLDKPSSSSAEGGATSARDPRNST